MEIFPLKSAEKVMNKEFIFSKKYDYDLSRGGINLSHSVMVGAATGMSAPVSESFLCRKWDFYSYQLYR